MANSGAPFACGSTFPRFPDATFYVSAETSSREGENGVYFDVELTGAALVEATASIGTTPARYLPGRLDRREDRLDWRSQLSELEWHIVETAAEVDRKRGSSDPIEIWDDSPPEQVLARRSLDGLHPLEVRQLLEDQDYSRRQAHRRPVGKLRLR